MEEKKYEVVCNNLKTYIVYMFDAFDKGLKENDKFENLINHDKNTLGGIASLMAFWEKDWELFEYENIENNPDFKNKWEEIVNTYLKGNDDE